MVVVVTCRDDETDAARPLGVLRHALRRSGAFAALPLGGFTVDEVAFVVSAVLAGPYEGAVFAQRAHDVCCGNPFFLAEIVRDCLAAPAVLAEPPLPLSVATSIEGRVDRLSPDAQSLARIAAVVGRAFTVEIVAAAAGTSEAIGVHCMDELLDARLVREASGEAERGGDFVFAHDLVRAQLYARIPDTLRRRLHRRVGFVLETLHAQEHDALAIELARHFDEGLEAEKAAAAYLISARQALRLYADGEALRALSRAAELTGDPELRYRAISLREEIHGRAGRRAEQLTDLETLESLADAAGDESGRLDVMRRRIAYARATDDVAGQQHWIDTLRAQITSVQNRSWSAFCNEASAALLTSLGRYDEALAHAREAVHEYQNIADDAGRVRSLCQIADVSALRNDAATARTALDDATAIAVASSNEASIVRALAASALAAYMAADYESARIPAERALELCRTIGDREGEADCLFRLGNIAGRRFAVGAAIEMYASATAIYDALNKPLGQAIVLLNTGLLYLKIGEHAPALAALKSARAVFAELNDLRGLTVCALNLGMAAYLRGRFAAALRLSQKAVELAHRLGSAQLECTALGNAGAAERELGQCAASVSHSEAALDMRRRIAPMDIGSDLADMGLTYLRAGDLRAACAIAEEIEALPGPALESVMFPQNVLWSAARIYAAAKLEHPYARALQRAGAMYDERCAKIPEGPWRHAYRLLFFNRQIHEARARAQHSDAVRTAGGVHSGA
jgi:tetratricopeptide (TPR) repeat protein